jgi:hypothetical protein
MTKHEMNKTASLRFGILNLGIGFCLGFGAWDLGFTTQNLEPKE